MIIPNTFTKIGLGTSRIASLGNSLTTKEANVLFNTALDNNVRLIDTADTYGSGDAERMVGNAIAGKRNDFFIITKAGIPYMSLPQFCSPLNQIGKKVIQKIVKGRNFSKNYLVKSLHKSLKRLQTDCVDAFVLHEPLQGELGKYNDTWEALHFIKKNGMAKSVGISTNDINDFTTAKNNGCADIVQTAMPYEGKNVGSVFDLCTANNIPVVVNQVLRSKQYLLQNSDFKNLMQKQGKSEKDIIAILIAYGLYFKKADCILVGTKNPKHLAENATLNNDYKSFENLFNEIAAVKL
jgi:pyridoxine 4-dehydrogenase